MQDQKEKTSDWKLICYLQITYAVGALWSLDERIMEKSPLKVRAFLTILEKEPEIEFEIFSDRTNFELNFEALL